MPHPFRRKAAVLADSVLVLHGIGGLQNGDGDGGFPGDLAGRVRCGINKGIHTHLMFLWGVGETAVTLDFHSAPLRLAQDGVGHGLALGIGNFQFPGTGQVFVSFQSHILCHGSLILFTKNGQGQLTFFRYMILIDGQIPHCHFPVDFCANGRKSHLGNLLCGENISRLQNPGTQAKSPFGFGKVRNTDAGQVFLLREIPRGKAIAGTAFHFRGHSRPCNPQKTAQRHEETKKTLQEHGSYLQ